MREGVVRAGCGAGGSKLDGGRGSEGRDVSD